MSLIFLVSAVFLIIVILWFSYIVAVKWIPACGLSRTFWSNFWSIFSNGVLSATLIVVAYYTFETYQIRKAAVNQYNHSFRPILVFNASKPRYTVTNKGSGPALNSCLIMWDGKKFKITSDMTVPGVITASETYLFNNQMEINLTGIKEKLPAFVSLINRIASSNHALFCLVYRDLAGNRFYSIVNGSGADYDAVFEHGEVM